MTDNAVTVNPIHLNTNDPAQLHCQYPGEMTPQVVCISLDLEDGDFDIAYDPNVGGGRSAREFHGIVQRWVLESTPTASAANDLLDELTPAAQAMLNTATVEFDGSNWVGRCDDPDDLAGQIEDLDDGSLPVVEVHDAADWIEDIDEELAAVGRSITADTSDDEINTIADEIESAARSQCSGGGNAEDYMIIEGLGEYLTEHRDNLRDGERSHVEDLAIQIHNLEIELQDQVRKIYNWKAVHPRSGKRIDSTRALADRIDRSHTTVNGWVNGD